MGQPQMAHPIPVPSPACHGLPDAALGQPVRGAKRLASSAMSDPVPCRVSLEKGWPN